MGISQGISFLEKEKPSVSLGGGGAAGTHNDLCLGKRFHGYNNLSEHLIAI